MKSCLILLAFAIVVAAQGPPPPKQTKPAARPVVTKAAVAEDPKPLGPDPCEKKECKGVGEECQRSKSNPSVAECVCISSCSDRELPDPLCTNAGSTFNSICEYERAQCNCKKGGKCPKKPGEYIVYYAECSTSYCNKNAEMIEYPRRVAQWLRDTHAARSMLPSDSETNNEEIMNPLSQRDRRISADMYNDPNGNAIYISWWFCNLDQNNDGQLDKREVSVVTRALMPNEQCIENFLSSCDSDSSTKISSTEWHGTGCFNVTKGQKSCTDLYKANNRRAVRLV